MIHYGVMSARTFRESGRFAAELTQDSTLINGCISMVNLRLRILSHPIQARLDFRGRLQ